MTSENQWVEEARAGSTDAFGKLMETHQKQLLGFLFSYTGRLDVADDLTQETFVKAWRAISGFKGNSRFQTWLFQIGLNNLRRWGRRDTLRRFREQVLDLFPKGGEDSRGIDFPDRGGESDPVGRAENRAREKELKEAVGRLPPKEKMVFLLRHEQGMTMREIAETLEVAEGTAKAHLFHAVQKLRKSVEGPQ